MVQHEPDALSRDRLVRLAADPSNSRLQRLAREELEQRPAPGKGPLDLGPAFEGKIGPGDAVYRHPQGAIAVVHPDGAVEKFTATGVRNPKTSATAEKLASGHGRWERISNASPGLEPQHAARAVVPTPSAPEVERRSAPAPAGSRYRKPMDFSEAPSEDIPKYAADPEWHFQQKVDGVRAQLVVEPGKRPWFRSKAGEQLQSTTAAPVTRAILDHLGTPGHGPGYTVDGEIVDGKWHVFDMTVNGEEKVPWETRMDRAREWAGMVASDRVSALPVAKTEREKLALAHAVRVNGGEGVMMKRRGSSYDYGNRVSHSLKAKYVSTADVVVTKIRPDGKDSAEISAHDEHGVLRRIGTVPLGGKEKAGAVHEGDVIEVNYLYAMPGSHNLVQARMVKLRPDKKPSEATTAQLRRVSKDVLDESAMKKKELRNRVDAAAPRYELRYDPRHKTERPYDTRAGAFVNGSHIPQAIVREAGMSKAEMVRLMNERA